MTRQHAKSQDFTNTENYLTTQSVHLQAHYMILSIKHIVLCRVTGPNTLDLEIQNTILRYVSAKVGCLLGLGSPFLWKDGPLHIKFEETCGLMGTGAE